MVKHQFPPKGYNAMEYPLPHTFEYQFGLSGKDATKNSTICTLIRCVETPLTAIETIEVNPSNGSFAEETGSIIAPDSIVPKMNISMSAHMNSVMRKVAGDDLRTIKFNWMPIYMAFKDMYEAVDNKTDVEVEDILELTHTVAQKDATPLFNNIKCLREDDHPVSTIHLTETFSHLNLDTDLKMECVTFDETLMWNALRYYSNSKMLSKAMGKWNTVYLNHEHPWRFNSSNFTHPTVKRGNEYTFCGILFHVPLAGTSKQALEAGDVTTATSLIEFNVQVKYDEWNSQFDQTSA